MADTLEMKVTEGGSDVADGKSERPRDPVRFSIVMGEDLTADHAMRLLVSGRKKDGCDDLSISCRPQLLSCEPVAQCGSYNIPAPGCSPLECDPVKTQPSG